MSKIRELPTLRKPQKREARRFVQACQGIVISSTQAGGESGDRAERVVAYWIEQLTDLDADQVDDLDPMQFQDYQAAMNRLLAELLDRPKKKR